MDILHKLFPKKDNKEVAEEAIEKENRKRTLTGCWRKFAFALGAGLTILVFYTAFNGVFLPMIQIGIVMCTLLALAFLWIPGSKRSHMDKPDLIDILLVILCVVCLVWTLYSNERFIHRIPYVSKVYLMDKIVGTALLLMVLEAMLPFFLAFEGRKPRARELVVTAVLCALGVAGRAAFFMLPQCKPVLALTILAGAALGGETGFLVGAVTMLVSNILFSQGPWTPWQMLGMGLCGFLAGLVFHRGGLPRKREALCAYGAVSAFLVYGILLNAYSALLATGALTWQSLAVYCASGFAMDAVQAISTVIFLWFFTEPMLDKLERVKIKYGFM